MTGEGTTPGDAMPSGKALSGRVAVVTGGGTGIGRGICLSLAAAGATIVVAQPERTVAQAVVDEIAARGGSARAADVDVRSRESVQAMVRDTLAEGGRLDILVNNAALTGAAVVFPFLDCPDDLFDEVVRVNLKGAFMCAQEAARVMVARGRGSIVNVSSVGAFAAQEGADAYCATKAALTSLTRTMALGLAPHGIRVNAVAPGDIGTDRSIGGVEMRGRGVSGRHLRAVPLGRRGEPAEIGAVVAFLASDDASYITGETIVADGGFLIY